MPTYDFENKETGEVEELILKISEYDDFLKDNPQLKRVYLTAPHIDHDGGQSVLSRAGSNSILYVTFKRTHVCLTSMPDVSFNPTNV